MKKVFRRLTASVLAAATVFSCAITADAYTDKSNWYLYNNPHAYHTEETILLNYYDPGYKAVITNKEYGGAYNYVTIDGGIETITLTEVNVVCEPFKAVWYIDRYGDKYAKFEIKMFADYINNQTPNNSGEIMLKNM